MNFGTIPSIQWGYGADATYGYWIGVRQNGFFRTESGRTTGGTALDGGGILRTKSILDGTSKTFCFGETSRFIGQVDTFIHTWAQVAWFGISDPWGSPDVRHGFMPSLRSIRHQATPDCLVFQAISITRVPVPIGYMTTERLVQDVAGATTVSAACIQAVPTSYLPMVRFRSSQQAWTQKFTRHHQLLMRVKRRLVLAVTNILSMRNPMHKFVLTLSALVLAGLSGCTGGEQGALPKAPAGDKMTPPVEGAKPKDAKQQTNGPQSDMKPL